MFGMVERGEDLGVGNMARGRTQNGNIEITQGND